MELLNFTDEEQLANSGVRRKWLRVPKDTLPPVFYLPLVEELSIKGIEIIGDKPVRIRVARYERLPLGRQRGLGDEYKYTGDTFR